MRKVIEDLRNVNQTAKEKEDQHLKCLNNAISRCGNVHSEEEKIAFYVN